MVPSGGGRLKSRIESGTEIGSGTETGTDEPETDGTEQLSLYACRSCGSVYIATDKQRCSGCRTAVERIPSTLEET